jgi:hypothetical protein
MIANIPSNNYKIKAKKITKLLHFVWLLSFGIESSKQVKKHVYQGIHIASPRFPKHPGQDSQVLPGPWLWVSC